MSLKQPKSIFWKPRIVMPATLMVIFFSFIMSCAIKENELYKFTICDTGGTCARATTYNKVDGGVVFYYDQEKSEIVGHYSIKGR